MNPDIITEERLRDLISQQVGVRPEDITAHSIMWDLGCDDLDMIELIMAVEEETERGVPDEYDADNVDITFVEFHRRLNQALNEQ